MYYIRTLLLCCFRRCFTLIINLDGYNGKCTVVSFAKDITTLDNLVSEKLNIIYLNGNTLNFISTNSVLVLSEKNTILFNQCHNYDVFEINENGNAFLYYSNERVDNALILSSKCNSNCIMCPVSDGIRKKENTSVSTILDIINHIPFNSSHITITGGEPFVIGEDIFKIFESLRNKFSMTEFLLLTNGRALAYTPFFKKFMTTIPSNTIIGIPIHGHKSQLHDTITRSQGGFYQTLRGIKNLLNYNYKVELRIVVSKLNIQYLEEIADLIIMEFPNTYSVKFMGLEMLGNAAKNEDKVWVSYNEAFRLSKNAILKLIKNEIDVALYNFPLCAVEKEFFSICLKSITDYKVNYFDECCNCILKDDCGGVFTGSKRLAKNDIIAWR